MNTNFDSQKDLIIQTTSTDSVMEEVHQNESKFPLEAALLLKKGLEIIEIFSELDPPSRKIILKELQTIVRKDELNLMQSDFLTIDQAADLLNVSSIERLKYNND